VCLVKINHTALSLAMYALPRRTCCKLGFEFLNLWELKVLRIDGMMAMAGGCGCSQRARSRSSIAFQRPRAPRPVAALRRPRARPAARATLVDIDRDEYISGYSAPTILGKLIQAIFPAPVRFIVWYDFADGTDQRHELATTMRPHAKMIYSTSECAIGERCPCTRRACCAAGSRQSSQSSHAMR
jgi:hypothetical protein